MASIHREIIISAPAERVWSAVRDAGAVDRRLVPGVLVDSRLDGDCRVVTFANGMVARELLLDIDDVRQRFAYAVVESRLHFTHHSASMQVTSVDPTTSSLVWIADLSPDQLAEPVADLMDQGLAAMKKTLER
jgi:Polyketide cyclase / dehydrase and lipid transport